MPTHTLHHRGLSDDVSEICPECRLASHESGVKVKRDAFNAAGLKANRYDLLVFSRWGQVMFRFEKTLYENPRRKMLNKLWWSFVEKCQGLKSALRAETHQTMLRKSIS
jgi:hypothetical protein